MRFLHTRRFDRNFKKLAFATQRRFFERRALFVSTRVHPLLADHALHGGFAGHRSFSITGDVRVIYEEPDPGIIRLVDIGTHHELYGT